LAHLWCDAIVANVDEVRADGDFVRFETINKFMLKRYLWPRSSLVAIKLELKDHPSLHRALEGHGRKDIHESRSALTKITKR
jgi:hypothetical protein